MVSFRLYGTTASRFSRRGFLEDRAELFKLLEKGKIRPVIYRKRPLLEAAEAKRLLEIGQVIGKTAGVTSPGRLCGASLLPVSSSFRCRQEESMI